MRKRQPRGRRKSTCCKCEKELEPTRKGKQAYCKACHAAHMRLTRPKHRDLKPLAHKKANVRAITHYYVKKGKIQKENCKICNSPNSQTHHPNYDKPLEVIWLCRDCHLNLHSVDLITF